MMMAKNHVLLVRDRVDQRNKGASKEQSKIRVLAIERMLDEGHLITAQEIQRRLDLQYDMQASLKTIYDDIYAIDRFIPLEVKTGFGGGYKKCDCREVNDG
jgi:predicted DNA-binding transcriptional regulator YafY